MTSLYTVEVIITNKKNVRDPEGETIHRQLILRKGFNSVKSVRAGKYLVLSVESSRPEEAIRLVKDLCEKLRIYNPVVHDIEVRLHD